MSTLITLIPTLETLVLGLAAGVLLAAILPTPSRRKQDATAAGRAAAERVIAELAAARDEASR